MFECCQFVVINGEKNIAKRIITTYHRSNVTFLYRQNGHLRSVLTINLGPDEAKGKYFYFIFFSQVTVIFFIILTNTLIHIILCFFYFTASNLIQCCTVISFAGLCTFINFFIVIPPHPVQGIPVAEGKQTVTNY